MQTLSPISDTLMNPWYYGMVHLTMTIHKTIRFIGKGRNVRLQFHSQSFANAVKLKDLIIGTRDYIGFEYSALRGSFEKMNLEIRKSLNTLVGLPSFLSHKYDCSERHCTCRPGYGSKIEK